MKPIILIAAAAAGTWMTATALAAVPSVDDKSKLERLAGVTDDAWNRGDFAGIAGLYVDDANLRLSGMKEPLIGRPAVRAYFEKAFAGRPKGMRHVTHLEHMEIIAPGLAFSDANVRVERDNGDGTWTLVREFQNNSIAVRKGEDWKLVSVRAYALPQPVPAPSAAQAW